MKKYRKMNGTKSQQLNYSMQDDTTEEMKNKQVKEHNPNKRWQRLRNVREGFVRRNVLMP